jgi:hypothetical protein
MTTSKTVGGDQSKMINRVMYGLFVALSLYFLLVKNDISSAMSNLGISLIFDPFDQRVSFTNRPFYQRAWLIIHAAVVLTLLGWMGYDAWLR